MDRLNIEPGEDWPSEIEQGLDNAALFIVIWNKNAKESEWVRIEIARAARREVPIIPLVFDDTEIDIHLERRQYIDFRKGWFENIQELFVFLKRMVQQVSAQENFVENSWRWIPDPDISNRFLYENRYSIGVDKADFGWNDWTKRIVTYESGMEVAERWKNASSLVSLVTVPTEKSLIVDFDEVQTHLGFPTNPKIANDELPKWKQFPFGMFRLHRHLGRDYLWFDCPDSDQSGPIDINRLNHFLRFSQGGGIEFALSESLFTPFSDERMGLNYVVLLGIAWQMVNFSCRLYSKALDYRGNVQFIVNVIGTENVYLGGFAKGWGDPISNTVRLRIRTQNWKSLNKNLQFVYSLNLARFEENDYSSRGLMEDLGQRLQRSYGVSPYEPRHYLYQTDEFPWDQYYRDIWR